VDVSGIEPEALELTPVDWTSHPAEAEDFLTREYTLVCDDVVHAGSLLVHRNELILNIRKSTGQMLGSIAMFRGGLEPPTGQDKTHPALPTET